jgi:hypothetical protein
MGRLAWLKRLVFNIVIISLLVQWLGPKPTAAIVVVLLIWKNR